MSSIECACATDLRLRRSQSRCYAGGFLSVSGWVGWVPMRMLCSHVNLHPPPCHPLNSLSPRALRPRPRSQWGPSRSRANRQLTQFPPQRSLSFCLASPSSITISVLPSYSNLPFNRLGPPPTEPAAEKRLEALGYYPSHANGALIEEIQCSDSFFRYSSNNNHNQ